LVLRGSLRGVEARKEGEGEERRGAGMKGKEVGTGPPIG